MDRETYYLHLFEQLPIVTVLLILINVLIFAYGILSGHQDTIIREYGFIPSSLFVKSDSTGFNSPPVGFNQSHQLPKLITSMFLHANISHIAFNMIALGYLGPYAERSVGSIRFIIIYLVSGVAGALLHALISIYLMGNGNTLLVGASGAISGVLGIASAAGNIRAYLWLVFQIIFASIGSFTSLNIAFVAHIGGFLGGFLTTKLFIRSERRKRLKYWN